MNCKSSEYLSNEKREEKSAPPKISCFAILSIRRGAHFSAGVKDERSGVIEPLGVDSVLLPSPLTVPFRREAEPNELLLDNGFT
jgi:hypothetical protein